jgi:hypothetical protein
MSGPAGFSFGRPREDDYVVTIRRRGVVQFGFPASRFLSFNVVPTDGDDATYELTVFLCDGDRIIQRGWTRQDLDSFETQMQALRLPSRPEQRPPPRPCPTLAVPAASIATVRAAPVMTAFKPEDGAEEHAASAAAPVETRSKRRKIGG